MDTSGASETTIKNLTPKTLKALQTWLNKKNKVKDGALKWDVTKQAKTSEEADRKEKEEGERKEQVERKKRELEEERKKLLDEETERKEEEKKLELEERKRREEEEV